MKKDFFTHNNYKVLDVGIGMSHVVVLCHDVENNTNKVFGCGSTRFG